MHENDYYAERLKRLENSQGGKSQRELELEHENNILKQRLQMSTDPIRTKFMQSLEYREAWASNVLQYLHEKFLADWAKTEYAKNLDAYVERRIKEIKEVETKPQAQAHPQQQAQQFRQPNNPQGAY